MIVTDFKLLNDFTFCIFLSNFWVDIFCTAKKVLTGNLYYIKNLLLSLYYTDFSEQFTSFSGFLFFLYIH